MTNEEIVKLLSDVRQRLCDNFDTEDAELLEGLDRLAKLIKQFWG